MTATEERISWAVRVAAEAFDVEASKLRGGSGLRGSRSVSHARAAVSVVLRETFAMSSYEIAAALQLDHSSVLHHWQRLPEWCDRWPATRRRWEQVRAEVLRRYPHEQKLSTAESQ